MVTLFAGGGGGLTGSRYLLLSGFFFFWIYGVAGWQSPTANITPRARTVIRRDALMFSSIPPHFLKIGS
jgi:hypothetical protein